MKKKKNLPRARARVFSYLPNELCAFFSKSELLKDLVNIVFLKHPIQDSGQDIKKYPADIVVINVNEIGELEAIKFIKRLRNSNEELFIAAAATDPGTCFNLRRAGASCTVSASEPWYIYLVIMKFLNPEMKTPSPLHYNYNESERERRISRN